MGSLSLVDDREAEVYQSGSRYRPVGLVTRFKERITRGSRLRFEQHLQDATEEDDIYVYMTLAATRLQEQEQRLEPFTGTVLEDVVSAYP